MNLREALELVAYTDPQTCHPMQLRAAEAIVYETLRKLAAYHFPSGSELEATDIAANELMTMKRRAHLNALRYTTPLASDEQARGALRRRLKRRAIDQHRRKERTSEHFDVIVDQHAATQDTPESLHQERETEADKREQLAASADLLERVGAMVALRQRRSDARANIARGTDAYVRILRGQLTMNDYYAEHGDASLSRTRNRVQQRLSRYRARVVDAVHELVRDAELDAEEADRIVRILRFLGSGLASDTEFS